MKLDQLKKGFWGYKKASVYEYIALMEEEFSTKLLKKDEEYKENEEKYIERIRLLEDELKKVNQELENQKKEQMTISSTLMEATKYAEVLRKEAKETAKKERIQWEKELSESKNELNRYHKHVSNLREELCSILHKMENEAAEFEGQIIEIKSECPIHNMTLFERKNESGE